MKDQTMITERAPTDPMSHVETLLVDATSTLFGEYGMPLGDAEPTTEPQPFAEDESLVTAILGYAGDKVRGALVLLATTEAVARWAGGEGAEPCYDAVGDTIGEFANMVLGRLKYALLLEGVTIMLATPTTALGKGLNFPARSKGASSWVRFEAPTGRFYVRFDAVFDAGFAFTAAKTNEAPAAAGDMLLF